MILWGWNDRAGGRVWRACHCESECSAEEAVRQDHRGQGSNLQVRKVCEHFKKKTHQLRVPFPIYLPSFLLICDAVTPNPYVKVERVKRVRRREAVTCQCCYRPGYVYQRTGSQDRSWLPSTTDGRHSFPKQEHVCSEPRRLPLPVGVPLHHCLLPPKA